MIIRPVDTPKTPMVTIKIYLSHCGRTQQPTDTTSTVINQHAHYIPVGNNNYLNEQHNSQYQLIDRERPDGTDYTLASSLTSTLKNNRYY